MIDLYCERTAPGLWAEPLNALTNLAFFIAAALALRACRKLGMPAPGDRILIALTFAIGAGSLAFHTMANRIGMLADVLPIFLFQVVFLQQFATRVLGFRWPGVAALYGVFFGLIAVVSALPSALLNGSLGYAPALLMVVLLAGLQQRNRDRRAGALSAAAAVFVVSLGFRSIDMAVCEALPLGTHALWHLCNGAVLYLCMRSLWQTPDKKKPGQAPA